MAIPGVVSIGIGLGKESAPTIMVGLKEEDPTARDQVPASVDGYPVECVVVGKIRTQ